MATWPLERITAIDDLAVQIAGLAADAHHLLRAPIMRLKIVVGYAPILDGEVCGKLCGSVFLSQMSAQSKEGGKKSPGRAVPVFARTAHSGAGEKRSVLPNGHGRSARRMAVRDGLVGDVLHHAK